MLKCFSFVLLLILTSDLALANTWLDSAPAVQTHYISRIGKPLDPGLYSRSIVDYFTETAALEEPSGKLLDLCLESLFENPIVDRACREFFEVYEAKSFGPQSLPAIRSLAKMIGVRAPKMFTEKNSALAQWSWLRLDSASQVPLVPKYSKLWRDRFIKHYGSEPPVVLVNGKVQALSSPSWPSRAQFTVLTNHSRPWVFVGSLENFFARTPKLSPWLSRACSGPVQIPELKAVPVRLAFEEKCLINPNFLSPNKSKPFISSSVTNQKTKSSMGTKILFASLLLGVLAQQWSSDKHITVSFSP